MQAAHDAGIVHRDLKPANILLSANQTPKISDFGIAKRRESSGDTREGDVLGTPSYMAPEQATGRRAGTAPTVDIYALGAILYEMLTGRPPFRAATQLETMAQVVCLEPVALRSLNPAIPPDVETICLKCLAKDPSRRYATAAELAEDMRRWREHKPISARRISRIERMIQWSRRRPAIAALIALVVLISALGFGLVTWKWQEAEFAWQRAHETAGEAQRHRGRAQDLAVRAAFARALDMCEQGDLPRGILWLARSLKLTRDLPPEQPAAWEATIRWNLSAWRGQLCTLQAMLPHRAALRAGVISPDGRWALTAGNEKRVRLWDVTTGQELGSVRQRSAAFGVAFHPDGSLFATAGADGRLQILRVSPDGSTRLVHELHHPQTLRAVNYHPHGRQLATACEDGKARLWNAETYALEHELNCHSPVWSLAYSPDGQQLCVGSVDGHARIWSVGDGTLVGAPLRHPGGKQHILSVAFSPNRNLIATGSVKGNAYLWDVETASLLDILASDPGAVRSLAFSPDGLFLATSGEGRAVRFWDLAMRRLHSIPLRHSHHVNFISFGPKGRTLLTGGVDMTARIWRVPPFPPPPFQLATDAPAKSAAIHPRTARYLCGTTSRRCFVWDERGTAMWPAQLHHGEVWAAAFSPAGQAFVTGTNSGRVRTWKTDPREPLSPQLRHGSTIWDVAAGPDGTTFASASSAGLAHVFDLEGTTRLALKHPDQVTAVVFRPDGAQLVTGCADGRIRFFVLPGGQPCDMELDHAGRVSSLAFSTDGRLLISGGFDAVARLWDVDAGRQIGPVLEHDRDIIAVSFSPDSRLVATGSRDKSTRLWLAQTGQPLGPPLCHAREVHAVAFSCDGQTVYSLTGCDLRSASVPVSLQGSAVQITLRTEVSTGLTLNARGTIRSLDVEEWFAKRGRLQVACAEGAADLNSFPRRYAVADRTRAASDPSWSPTLREFGSP